MWHWDQGHLPYFQFDALRQISMYVMSHDFRRATRQELLHATGLAFAGPITYKPWRNYSRTLKISLLVSQIGEIAQPTPIAELLSTPGLVTCDEYLHFLVRAYTEPSPALKDWTPNAIVRYPLLFALKYLLAKKSIQPDAISTVDEIVGAYRVTGFVGDEADTDFIKAVTNQAPYEAQGRSTPESLRRQSRESIQVISQISYMHIQGSSLVLSLDPEDAHTIFHDLTPILGPRAADRESEIRRLAELFRDGSQEDFFDYPHTVLNDEVQSGFIEGSKVKKTHITIERNQSLRKTFFMQHPSPLCDVCRLDTAATYPWATRVLDLHHLLPLSSGTRVEQSGTTLDDLVAVCPTCHRAIHRFYDRWLSERNLADFAHENDARAVYQDIKRVFEGAIHA